MTNEDANVERYMARPYPLRLWYDDESEAWVCEADDLEGCVAHGSTPAEATEVFEKAKRAWVKAALRIGLTIPEPRVLATARPQFSGKFLLRLPRDLHEALAGHAASQGVSLNQYAATVLARALGSDEVRADVEWLANAYRAVLSTRWIQERAHGVSVASAWTTNVSSPAGGWARGYVEHLRQPENLEFKSNQKVAEMYGKATEEACH